MRAHVLQQAGHLDEALAAMKLASSLDPLSLPIAEAGNAQCHRLLRRANRNLSAPTPRFRDL
jgi:hypothetical protein